MNWQPIETAKRDCNFRFYGLHVTQTNGFTWFEAHYVAEDSQGQMIQPSGDNFDDWAYEDFEVWCDAPAPPEPADKPSLPPPQHPGEDR